MTCRSFVLRKPTSSGQKALSSTGGDSIEDQPVRKSHRVDEVQELNSSAAAQAKLD